jgi:hypothetical protein
MVDAEFLVRIVFSGLTVLTIDEVEVEVEDAGEVIVVRASTTGSAVKCPACGTLTHTVHAFCERMPADVPVDGRRVLLRVRVRRMRCRLGSCARQTFREQVPGVLERYQRRTVRLTEQLRSVVRELAGRAAARLLPGRGSRVVTDWLHGHPGVKIVCRDGSATYAQAVKNALPDAVQVSDRWHLWHGLAEAAAKEVAAHSACWAGATGVQDGPCARTTAERWRQVRDLLDQGVGLLECARRLSLGLNTIKRYARAAESQRLQRVPQYRPTLSVVTQSSPEVLTSLAHNTHTTSVGRTPRSLAGSNPHRPCVQSPTSSSSDSAIDARSTRLVGQGQL